jgi:HEPN domain-containing protein
MRPPRSLRQEQATLLLRKATQDEVLIDAVLEARQVHDETIGYHVQQAAEKLLKAVLAAHGVVYRRTHNLDELILLLSGNGISFPDDLLPVRSFTTFAVEPRYGDLPPEEVVLDRSAARDCLRRLRTWAEERIEKSP